MASQRTPKVVKSGVIPNWSYRTAVESSSGTSTQPPLQLTALLHRSSGPVLVSTSNALRILACTAAGSVAQPLTCLRVVLDVGTYDSRFSPLPCDNQPFCDTGYVRAGWSGMMTYTGGGVPDFSSAAPRLTLFQAPDAGAWFRPHHDHPQRAQIRRISASVWLWVQITCICGAIWHLRASWSRY